MRSQWLPFFVILAAATILAFFAQDFVDRVIILPVLYFVWVGQQLFYSVPQEIIWGFFLLVGVFVAWFSLRSRSRNSKKVYFTATAQPGRIEDWHKLIRRADQEIYYKWQLAQRLRKLTFGALAHDQRLTTKAIRRRLINANLGFPPEIQAYFQASLASFGNFPTARRPVFWLPKKKTPLDLEPEKIAQFLEEKFNS